MFIDTHTHLYDEQIAHDKDLIPRAIRAGVAKMYMPNCHSTTILGMLAIADEYPENCFPMLGLHPTAVRNDYKDELFLMEQWLQKRKFYAIGEIGLDFYWDLTYQKEQIDTFNMQMDLAMQHQLPIVIHARNSTPECVEQVRNKQNGSLKGIFHCFSGTLEEAKQVIDLGFYLGIGGVLTYKNSTLPEIVQQISLEHLVLETDAPYLAPVPYRGKLNESSYIPLIANKLASIKQMSIEELARITTANAEKIFGNINNI